MAAGSQQELDGHEELEGLEGLDRSPPREAVLGPSGKVYSDTSLFCLRVGDAPRRICIRCLEHPVFDPFILLTILCNCTTMAWESPLDPPGTPKAAFIDTCEWAYLAIFTFELVTKIIAYGFALSDGAYLRDPWCQLDFIVVSLAWIPIVFPSFGNYSVIRSVRALRPLRALKRMPGMPVLISSLLQALPALGNVLMLCGLLFLVLGIMGVKLFKGTLHYRCALDGFVESAAHPSLIAEVVSGLDDEASIRRRWLRSSGGSADDAGAFDSGEFCDPLAHAANCPMVSAHDPSAPPPLVAAPGVSHRPPPTPVHSAASHLRCRRACWPPVGLVLLVSLRAARPSCMSYLRTPATLCRAHAVPTSTRTQTSTPPPLTRLGGCA